MGEAYLKDADFRSTGDTEVILRLYERYGFDRAIGLLNGMFAIAVIDARLGRLFLARDRVGIKPLYYYEDKGEFAFASELKALTVSGIAPAKINELALYETMLFSFPYRRTLIQDVLELPPAGILEYSLENASCHMRSYWDVVRDSSGI